MSHLDSTCTGLRLVLVLYYVCREHEKFPIHGRTPIGNSLNSSAVALAQSCGAPNLTLS